MNCRWVTSHATKANVHLYQHLANAQKQIRSLRIDKDDISDQLTTAKGRALQITHELEAEKGEVQVKTAEVKKLTERINTMKNEQEMLERAKITAERKMVSFILPPPFHCVATLPQQSAEQELQEMKNTVDQVKERAQEKEGTIDWHATAVAILPLQIVLKN